MSRRQAPPGFDFKVSLQGKNMLFAHCGRLVPDRILGIIAKMIRIKRAYAPAEKSDGRRFLVDHLWPRGLKKEALHIEGWLKDVAPSDALRKWFKHEPAKWNEFQKRYFAELDSKPETWSLLVQAAQAGTVTLLFSARDTEHNNAVALQQYLSRHMSLKEPLLTH